MSNNETVKESLSKKGTFGADLDLDKYVEGTRDPDQIDELKGSRYESYMRNVGIVSDQINRSGTLMFIDNGMSHCSTKYQDGLEMISLKQAIKKHDGLKDYYWKIMDPTKDKYTAKSYLESADGYFIHVKSGYHIKNPVQTCMILNGNKSIQNLHNIVIVDDDASLEMITGCSTTHINEAIHIGVSEIYVGNNSNLTFSMIHSWGKQTGVRPRTSCLLGSNSNYINNYVILDTVGSLQSFPVATIGENSSATYNTMCISHKGSDIDTGGMVNLNGKKSRAEIMSRSISAGGRMCARGRLVGNAPEIKAHLECRSIIVKDGGTTIAVPELEANLANVDMTHEAAVGKIARDQIEYLMSRGLNEDQAVSMIVRGFLSGSISGLPNELQENINKAIEEANLGN